MAVGPIFLSGSLNEGRADLLLRHSETPATAVTAEGELWRLAVKKLVVWTVKKHRMNPADAEQVVQEAILLFLQAGGQADPNNPKALIDKLGSNINGIAVNRRRKKAELAVRLTAGGVDAELEDPPDAEQGIADDQLARKVISTLLERIGDDELATAVVMQMIDGVDNPADQARALGRDVREVYNARRRLKAHVEAIKELMETWLWQRRARQTGSCGRLSRDSTTTSSTSIYPRRLLTRS